jgi:Kef-type K+ transport system membrane component KefB
MTPRRREGRTVLVGTVEATLLILLLVIVFGPTLFERFGIPGIVGLIFGGMLFGPFMIGWLEADGLVNELGAIGILYLMFLAGLSFNIRAFFENRNSAVTYGLLGFAIPFVLSIVVVLALFDITFLGAALIGAMWASNTLVAYPEVQAAGLQGNRAVSAAVSAGVVADLLSLTVLALATATAVIEVEPLPLPFGEEIAEIISEAGIEPSNPDPTLPLWIGLPLLVVFCLWLLLRVTEWFFVRVGRSRMQRFVFALAGMAAGAVIALMGGIEGLIGAFLAGLGMNRLVPAQGPLMERIDFVGTSIFIPTFLVSIGLNIDPALLFDPETLALGALFTLFVLVGKSIAAAITGAVFGFSPDEVGLMSSLSFGQAASTLAIAQVGLSLGMFEQIVVNAAVLAIVATALVTSYGTRFFVRRVPRPAVERAALGEKVLLDVRAHGSDLDAVIDFASAVAADDDGLVVPYSVPEPGQLEGARVGVDDVAARISAHGLDSEGIVRVDDSVAEGTIHLVEEHGGSLVVLSWAGPRFTSDYVLGNDIDAVGEQSTVPTVAARILRPWTRIVAVLGDTDVDWHAEDARLVLSAIARLRRSEPAPLLAVARDASFAEEHIDEDDTTTEVVTEPSDRRAIIDRITPDDLVVVAAHVLHDLSPTAGWRVTRAITDTNIAVIAGPHRLTVSRGTSRRHLATTVTAPA